MIPQIGSVSCTVCGAEQEAIDLRKAMADPTIADRQSKFYVCEAVGCGRCLCAEHVVLVDGKSFCREHGGEDYFEQRRCCRDCGVDVFDIGHWYMVHDAIWARTGLGNLDGFLCLDCLSTRIGRRLELTDFKIGVPVNRTNDMRALILRAVTKPADTFEAGRRATRRTVARGPRHP